MRPSLLTLLVAPFLLSSPRSCAVSAAALQVIADEALVQRAAKLGEVCTANALCMSDTLQRCDLRAPCPSIFVQVHASAEHGML
eukprot:922084-Pleurochrysis_carterae.AAC.2